MLALSRVAVPVGGSHLGAWSTKRWFVEDRGMR